MPTDFVLSPNMALPVPIVGVTAGPAYASYLDSCLSIVDGHSHVSGSGVQIVPAALNLNDTVTLNNNTLSDVKSVALFPQVSDPAIDSIYVKGVDLYYKDGSANVIRITQSGSVSGSAGTITGLPSGTASASFGAGVFVFQAATNTPANIDGGSFVFRNNIANSKGLTLAPPNAMGSNYGLVLPALPGSTQAMTLDSSGNMGTITYDAIGQAMTATGANAIAVTMTSTGADAIGADMTATGANAVANSRTRTVSTSVGVGGVAISAAGSLTLNTVTSAAIPNLDITITTAGRPVDVSLVGVSASSYFLSQLDGSVEILRDGVSIGGFRAYTSISVGGVGTIGRPVGGIRVVDAVGAGTYNYTARMSNQAAGFSEIISAKLVAYEL